MGEAGLFQSDVKGQPLERVVNVTLDDRNRRVKSPGDLLVAHAPRNEVHHLQGSILENGPRGSCSGDLENHFEESFLPLRSNSSTASCRLQ